MEAFHQYIDEYRRQLKRGDLRKAYRGLLEYVMALRTHFENQHPDYSVSGSIYAGYMDMTYFACVPKELKRRGLKIAIVLLHDTCGFEVWLAGANKRVQAKYWELFKQSAWNKYQLVPTIKGADAILRHVLVDNPDFSALASLTGQIERGTLAFVKEVERFLSKH